MREKLGTKAYPQPALAKLVQERSNISDLYDDFRAVQDERDTLRAEVKLLREQLAQAENFAAVFSAKSALQKSQIDELCDRVAFLASERATLREKLEDERMLRRQIDGKLTEVNSLLHEVGKMAMRKAVD
jgi:chromosome segregation ATPase